MNLDHISTKKVKVDIGGSVIEMTKAELNEFLANKNSSKETKTEETNAKKTEEPKESKELKETKDKKSEETKDKKSQNKDLKK